MMLEENRSFCQFSLGPPKTEEYIELEQLAKQIKKHNERKMAILQKASGNPKKATEKSENSDVEMTDTSPDTPSKFGKFGWHEIEGNVLPYLTRINPDIKLVSRRMANVKIFSGLKRCFNKEILDCLTVHPIPATAAEANLLNDINQNHSDNCYGAESFKEKDSLVLLSDIMEMVEFLRYCCYVFDNGLPAEKMPCGFMKIGQETVPYVVECDKRYMPLFYFDGDLKPLQEKAVEISGWKLPYLKLLCKIQGVRREFFEGSSLKSVHLDYLKTFFPPDTPFEETWPVENKLAYAIQNTDPTQRSAQAQTANFPVPPPNISPNFPVPPPNISPNFPLPHPNLSPNFPVPHPNQSPNFPVPHPNLSPNFPGPPPNQTPNIQQFVPTPNHPPNLTVPVSLSRMSPSTFTAQRMSPSTVNAPRTSPSIPNPQRISPPMPNLQRISPPTASAQRILPPTVNAPAVSRLSRPPPPPYSQPSLVTVEQAPRLRDIRRSPNNYSMPPRISSNLTNGTTHNRYQHNMPVLPDSTTSLGYRPRNNRPNGTNAIMYGQPRVRAPTFQIPSGNNYVGPPAPTTPPTYETPSRKQYAYVPPPTDNHLPPTGGKFPFMYDPPPNSNHVLQGTILTNDACLIECINNPQIEADGVTLSVDQLAKVYYEKPSDIVLKVLVDLRVKIYRPTQHQSQMMKYSRFNKAYGMVNVTDVRHHLKVIKLLLL